MERHWSRTFPRERQIVQRVPKGARYIAHSLQRQPQPQRMDNFSNSLQQLAEGNTDRLYREREKLARSYEMKKNEIQTYENNKGFLSLSSSRAESLVQELDRKIKKLHEEMNLIVQKIDRRKIEISNNDCVSDLGYWIHTRA